MFARDASGITWSQRQKILAEDGAAVDYFGRSVSIYGKIFAAGAYSDDNSGGIDAGTPLSSLLRSRMFPCSFFSLILCCIYLFLRIGVYFRTF